MPSAGLVEFLSSEGMASTLKTLVVKNWRDVDQLTVFLGTPVSDNPAQYALPRLTHALLLFEWYHYRFPNTILSHMLKTRFERAELRIARIQLPNMSELNAMAMTTWATRNATMRAMSREISAEKQGLGVLRRVGEGPGVDRWVEEAMGMGMGG